MNESGRHIIACGQLGTYGALIEYAIDALRGKTYSSLEEVASRIESRHQELIQEQSKIFNQNNYHEIQSNRRANATQH